MGWLELLAWCGAMNRQRKGPEVDPDSWAHADQDEWWVEQRRRREEERREARGF